jgi:hypothetical protein
MSSMTSRLDQRRAAKNQSLFRDVNKRVNDINKAHDLWVTLSDWFCECPVYKCTTRIALTPQQYEAVRAHPTHFIITPAGSISSRTWSGSSPGASATGLSRRWGEAAAVAEQLDPSEPTANDAAP